MLKPFYSEDQIEAGLDEAGRGCLAGPVVAAAVVLPRDFSDERLNDSKKLSEKQRDILAEVIEKEAIAFSVAEVSSVEIDKINILNASFLAMHRALDSLPQRPQLLLVDGNRFTPYQSIPHKCIVKGDATYMSIAAASILAKTYRDALMKQLSEKYKGYGWEKNAGYPTMQHRAAIKEIGVTPMHRMSFTLLPKQLTIF